METSNNIITTDILKKEISEMTRESAIDNYILKSNKGNTTIEQQVLVRIDHRANRYLQIVLDLKLLGAI